MKPKRVVDPYLMLFPTIAFLALFFMVPLAMVVKNSFYSWDLLTAPRFVGAANYRTLLSSGELSSTFVRTMSYSAVVVALSVTLGLTFALALNREGKRYAFARGAIFSAYVVSWVAVALLWMWILDADRGLLTRSCLQLTRVLRSDAVSSLCRTAWLNSPSVTLYVLALVTVWKITGYSMIIFLAGLQDIPVAFHEAASLDGASAWNRFRHITWPLLAPSTLFVSVTSLILSFQAFDIVRVMTQGGPGQSTTIFVYAIYEQIFVNLRIGRASALTVVFVFILALLTLLQWKASRSPTRASR